ncbi:MAG TPA: polyprenyl synthetase family protein [Nitrospiria bacterium]|nr:polyprenyl synthetase family protein [Nitrospiria bacterium]
MQTGRPEVALATMQDVWDFYRTDLQEVEVHIEKYVDSGVPLINQVALYILTSGGKRIRPLLLMISARLSGFDGPADQAVTLASSIEYIHAATLLHDDVLDDATLRRGKDPAHAVWGNRATILVGDYLYTKAVCLAVQIGLLEVDAILANACRIMAEGEALQLLHCGDLSLTDEAYLKVVECKTAALISAACRLGGVISGAPWRAKDALSQFGMHLGIAYQVADDTLDYVADQGRLGKALGKDLSEGKITLPLLHLLRSVNGAERRLVETVVRDGQASPEQLRDILDLMHTYGSTAYALDVARQHITLAQQHLEEFDNGPHRRALSAVADYVVARDH